LAAYLFKIDSYLNIVRGQPSILTAEELHYSLPSTFSLYNTDGLDIFEERYSIEPTIRSQTTICDMIQDAALDSVVPTDGLMLEKDIQLGICALQGRLWHLLTQNKNVPDLINAIELDPFRRCLESWKRLLIRIPTLHREQPLAIQYYYGKEDHSEDGWQSIVSGRQKSLVYDAVMVYHVFSLHIYANMRILSQLAEDNRSNKSKEEYGVACQESKTRREAFAREWARTPNSRRALCHAAAVFASYKSLPVFIKSTLDPITHVALSIGALVIWAYGSFATHTCQACTPGLQTRSVFPQIPEIELTRWSRIDSEPSLEREKGTWIEMGGGRVTLMGTKLCRCNLDLSISRYYSCLPEGWNVADTIAPGIWTVPDTRSDV
jgi:hypothetical protein